MASVQYYAATSLDGYLARPDGNIDWLLEYGADRELDGPMSDGSYDEFYEGIGALVMGSATYEWILAHMKAWPYDRPAWVFSTRELPQPPGGEVVLARDGHHAVCEAAMKAAGGKHVWMLGGGNIASQWAAQGLIDEAIITLVPVVLGEGLPFLASGIEGALRLAATKPYANGMVELRYAMPTAHGQ